jgi:CRISPR-associated protein Cmr6
MDVPQMFRAQVQGRCSLQYTPDQETRNQWLKEWIDPEENGQIAQHSTQSKPVGLTGSIYRIQKKFSYRVFTNSGLDSIFRPPLGKNGIPFIPGSGIKGLFKRACTEDQKAKYCGSTEKPGELRFHGVFPIGDWAKKVSTSFDYRRERFTETSYGVMDLVHPQQIRQVESQEQTSAIAVISFLEPTFIFEFSSDKPDTNWSEVEQILERALKRGLGGKTSNGYGFPTKPSFIDNPETFHLSLNGMGVSSVLLAGKVKAPKSWKDDIPSGKGKIEFRPQLFKASLRGHLQRLLAGICDNPETVKQKVNEFFGSSECLGKVNIFWEKIRLTPISSGRNPTYTTQGKLHLYSTDHQDFLVEILQFAYIMSGFGKTWRRVAHEIFFPSYHQDHFAIGCHWTCQDRNFVSVNSRETLSSFLDTLYQSCQELMDTKTVSVVSDWRESWHPDRVSVYSLVTNQSMAIKLFHDPNFKTTEAIGGRLDQLKPFIKALKDRGLVFTWGKNL